MSVSYSGWVNGEGPSSLTTAPSVTTTATTTSPVGSYPITAAGAVDPNYAITYVPGQLSVGQFVLTIAVNNASKTYGSANPAFSVTYSGWVNGEGPSSLTAAPSVSHHGHHRLAGRQLPHHRRRGGRSQLRHHLRPRHNCRWDRRR